jgi:hypothetical protein
MALFSILERVRLKVKTCSKCKAEKPVEEYGIRRMSCDGLKSQCKACEAAARRNQTPEQRKKERERAAIKRAKNKDKILEYQRKWRKENWDKVCEKNRQYNKAYREREKQKRKELEKKEREQNAINRRQFVLSVSSKPLLDRMGLL